MLFRRTRRARFWEEEIDPLSGLANLLDIMLVFSCGLMVAMVLSWNLQSVFFSKATPEEKQKMLQVIQKVINVEQGKELQDLPKINEGGGSGYQEMGTVYKDPQTGKFIMIETTQDGVDK